VQPWVPIASGGGAWGPDGGRTPVAMLLGKAPERSPVMPDVIDHLRDAGADVRVHLPQGAEGLPDWLLGAHLAALRGLGPGALTAAAAREEHGLRCCNSARASLAARNRSLVQRRLADAGVPVPAAADVPNADAVVESPAGPAAVDVNAFPSCAGVPGAATSIAATLFRMARR
jgi:hypothetical protein